MEGRLIITTKKGTVIEEELVVHLDEDLVCESVGAITGEDAKKLKDGQTVEVQGRTVRLTVPCPFCKSYECYEKNKAECPTVYAGKR